MNLMELKRAADAAIESANEYGESPECIVVSLQIDCGGVEAIYTDEHVELHYDNNTQVSGCVMFGCIP